VKLIIEVDGDVHAFQEEKDARRTADLETQGYRVLWFWNEQVLRQMDGVLAQILLGWDEKK
jgi:very-short-patch-repair endonuclease